MVADIRVSPRPYNFVLQTGVTSFLLWLAPSQDVGVAHRSAACAAAHDDVSSLFAVGLSTLRTGTDCSGPADRTKLTFALFTGMKLSAAPG
ncbi:hypothetical protein ABFZ85_08470 [Hyphococcus formosus]|uniref:hypothetical protein n=1 Tax=Hyphococcus formosus TaxID=3143534 RepID=UPI00398B553C